MEEKKNKTLRIIIGALIVLVLLYVFVFSGSTRGTKDTSDESDSMTSPVDITLENVDISATATDEEKLPQGFPVDIPVELANVTESYSATYEDAGFTQYTVAYTSERSMNALGDEYSEYLDSNGYTITDDTSGEGFVSWYATKDNNDLSVLVSYQSDTVTVTLTYLARK